MRQSVYYLCLKTFLLFLIFILLSGLYATKNSLAIENQSKSFYDKDFILPLSNKLNKEGPLIFDIEGHLFESRIPNKYKEKGVKEIISFGVSDYSNSLPSRIQNIRTAAKKFDGILISQGETFSFNEILKSVHPKHGYVKDLVIKNGRNVWEQGGGVCQLSTSVFRAALNAGLEIKAARNHSMAIPYYKPYGIEAAIYMPYLDVKFKNNTPGDILMQVVMHDEKLVVVLYGTNDGRKVFLAGPYVNQKLKFPTDAQGLEPSVIYDKKWDYKSHHVQWVRSIELSDGDKKDRLFTAWYSGRAM